MVYAKQLEMRGFKSFGPKKVTITLDKAITTITGPNGSGKSNIIDAIRFVLGEMGVRSLRADKMAAVIFDGTPKMKKANSAFVAIQFDNSDRGIPVEADNVTFSRTVREDGTSVYRLNGKKVLRSNLVDILGVSGLTPSGLNIIMQGTIMRIADFTPNERRVIIEDMIGIAEYDAKKASSNEQLQQANINLRVASAKIGEVQNRLESLEIERNDAQRYNFIQREIKRMQATIISQKTFGLKEELNGLNRKVSLKKQETEKLKREKNRVIKKKTEIIQQRKRFEDDFSKKGGEKLLNLEKTISDKKAQRVTLKTSIDAASMRLQALVKTRDERTRQLEKLKRTIQASSKDLRERKSAEKKVALQLDQKKKALTNIMDEAKDRRQSLYNAESEVNIIDDALEKIDEETLKLKTELKEVQTKQEMFMSRQRTLQKRRTEFESNITTLKVHLDELQKMMREEQQGLYTVSKDLTSNTLHRDTAQKRLFEAEKTSQKAKGVLNEYVIKRKFEENFLSEEKTLEKIEEIAENENIEGIYGKLASLVTYDSKYEKALESAANGWLNALVVKDLEIALKVLEILKRLKIGRLKILPMKELVFNELDEPPDIDGILGFASNVIKIGEKNALAPIFKNTVITDNGRTAYLASKNGYRAIDIDGDLYEECGIIEGGYYKSAMKALPFGLSVSEIGWLHRNVDALESLLEKRRLEVNALEDGVKELVEARVLRARIVGALENEVENVTGNVKRVEDRLKILDDGVAEIDETVNADNENITSLKGKLEELDVRRRKLSSKKERLKPLLNLSSLTRQEELVKELEGEINELDRSRVKISGDVRFLESNMDTTLKPEVMRARLDLKSFNKQTSTFQDRIEETKQLLQQCQNELSEHERTRKEMYKDLSSVRLERRKFETQLGEVDVQINKLDQKYQPISEEIHQLDLELHERKTEITYLERELEKLGYTEVTVKITDLDEIKLTLGNLQRELEGLGSVNQLAIYQYNGLKDNYKHLSLRINQLEEEKKSILKFIEELERKKRETFMKAYNQINSNFKSLFTRLTGGGSGWLQLPDPEDPLSGGIDVFVQFPGKSPRLVAGASGGEKSVVAVAFILALQRLSKFPFYVFDEIDAHLDLYYAERLAELLVDESKASQFIVVSLRDVMINQFEKIFGVYSQDGISKIVSMNLKEVPA